jgi:hypothetical protein
MTPDPYADDPTAVRLWLPTKLPDGRADDLYIKTIRTAHTPREGDRVYLTDDTDDDVGVYTAVRNAFHDATGRYNAYLTPVIENPDRALTDIDTLIRSGHYTPWRTDDGDQTVHSLLAAAGWTEWEGTP